MISEERPTKTNKPHHVETLETRAIAFIVLVLGMVTLAMWAA